ncbi:MULTISPECIES: hypothetical protein [unclassified Mesorhizobium]|uniref:hypothetical protein n=1 Tax=unclassified Mesorhizobium TaxID=325217 RepID=UPI000FCAB7DA|nr:MULTISPECIES: hypothetical protein [unclassified Mesorhizobium]RUX97443.1 hypothetical protein EN993_03840 [Mesorhizobium sp. M7D.F.Ca.US.004.01.2.1]RVA36629.1 hypothetical protein EN935_01650 [Mesorhizobium sp. M7D.F.Ca.US.004.03.1.1]
MTNDPHALAQQAVAAYEATRAAEDIALNPYRERARAAFTNDGISANWDPLFHTVSWVPCNFRAGKEGKVAKVPLNQYGYAVDVNNPANHMPIRNAAKLCRDQPSRFEALGFAFTPQHQIVGIDIDLYKLEPGSRAHTVAVTALKFPTLTARSMGGKGFHMFGVIATPCERLRAVHQGLLGAIEIYWQQRFFAMTMDAVKDVPIADVTELVNYIFDEHVAAGGTINRDLLEGLDLPPADGELEQVIEQVRAMKSWSKTDPRLCFLFPLEREVNEPAAIAYREAALDVLTAKFPENGRADKLPYDANKVDMTIASAMAQKTSNINHYIEVMHRNGLYREKYVGYVELTWAAALRGRKTSPKDRREHGEAFALTPRKLENI